MSRQIPHRDFDDMYTGGLSYLNGLSFQIFGVHSMSMRWMLFGWQLLFLIGVYGIAARLLQPAAAALVTILANLWSIPLYSAAMPSWYNLYFAVWVAGLLFVFCDRGSRKFLLFSGVGIGASIAIKSSGLFLLAATLLLLLYRNQIQFPKRSDDARWLSLLISVALIGASLLSLVFVTVADPIMQSIHFVIPFMAVTLFVLHHEWTSATEIASVAEENRLRSLLSDVATLAAGVMLPLLVLLQVFWRADALSDFYRGVFVFPKLRMEHASASFASWQSMLFCVPLLLVIYSGLLPRQQTDELAEPKLKPRSNSIRLWPIGVGLIAFAALLISCWTKIGFAISFFSFRNAIPLVVLANLFILYLRRNEIDATEKQQLFAVTAICFFVSLIQFPFAVSLYFFYAAPLGLLAAVAGANACQSKTGWLQTAVLVFLIAMAIFRFDGTWPDATFNEDFQKGAVAKLKTSRSQLWVSELDAVIYGRLQAAIEQHSSPGDTVFATPDCPEVCFLTDRNPFNGIMYEFFRPELYVNEQQLVDDLVVADVKLVVINERPPFSKRVSKTLVEKIEAEFELVDSIGNDLRETEPTPVHFSVYRKRQRD